MPTFGKRSIESQSIEVKRKYFFAFEGNKTEYTYFIGLRNNSKELEINDLIEIIPLDRDADDRESHPLKVLEKVKNSISSIQYDSEFDKIFIIVDRDEKSFSSIQYDKFYSTCVSSSINIGITNPCFELWLLCHLNNFNTYDKKVIFQNKKINRSKTFIEKELSNNLGGYNKSKLDFSKFKDSIDNAIENEKSIEQDILKIKNELGSNIGVIIQEMKK